MNIKECPSIMEEQKLNNKKDRYIEITDTLLDYVCPEGINEKIEYAEILCRVLENMDFQIYELYRKLADRFTGCLKSIYELSKSNEYSDYLLSAGWENLVSFGVEKHFLLREWFTLTSTENTEIPVDAEEITLKLLYVTSRSATIELCGCGKYKTDSKMTVFLNGKEVDAGETVIKSFFDLLPGREYEITVINKDSSAAGKLKFRTAEESYTLLATDFGALGDGKADDTHPIQSAIYACPEGGRVVIPTGEYRIIGLFLKSGVNIELKKGAVLKAIPERAGHGIFPGVLPSADGNDEYNLGTWEGNPLPMFSAIICGIGVKNVSIYGEGVIDGAADFDNWWHEPKVMNMAYRPRLFFIKDSKRVYLQGVTLKNSPSWTIHPFFSEDLGFYNIKINNPFNSPNTDGLDPESCRNIEIAGVEFSLGDDCIAVKAGKIYMGKKFKKPSESIRVHNCLMQNGHGAVTIGSEMAGGVKNLTVEDCDFVNTDRGLRIKTRRGRGRDAVLDRIIFRNIKMDHVMTPFVVNSFYFCDPDGKTDYVQSREFFPADERTPLIRRLEFEDIEAVNCHVAAAYIEGLPEAKIEELIMRHIDVSYADNPKCDVPAMSNGVEKCSLHGIFIRNVKRVTLDHVSISGNVGEAVVTECVDELNKG